MDPKKFVKDATERATGHAQEIIRYTEESARRFLAAVEARRELAAGDGALLEKAAHVFVEDFTLTCDEHNLHLTTGSRQVALLDGFRNRATSIKAGEYRAILFLVPVKE